MRRIIKSIKGTSERPRLVVSKSLNNVYAQVIDDNLSKTLVGISSLSLDNGRANVKNSTILGEKIAEEAIKLGIKKVVFDRGDCIYHGRIKAVADGARNKGLEF